MRKILLTGLTMILLGGLLLGSRPSERIPLGERSYRLHVPGNLTGPAPLLLALHGGGGNAAQFERWTGFSELAEREGFLVAYPEGVGHNWNDGRQDVKAEAFRQNVDDVGFLRAVVEDVGRRHPLDRSRVFATGASNGGFMASRLGIEAPDLVSAIAPVIGGIPAGLTPHHPVRVLIIQGTEDPLVPYAGGEVKAFGRARGRFRPTEEAVALWCAANDSQGPPRVTQLPDLDPQDGCLVEVYDYGSVRLYKVVGGGHTWPGAGQYLPVRTVGRVCRDFSASATIWEFLAGR